MKKPYPVYALILVILFGLWIWTPFAFNLFTLAPGKKVSVTENRLLAELPVFDIGFLDPFPGQYEKYYSDHFPGREEIASCYSRLMFSLFQKSPLPDEVSIGQQQWLYTSGKERKVFEGRFTLTPSQISLIVYRLHERAVFYHQKGIVFYVTVAPMKCEIYPEYLPSYYIRNKNGTVTDLILEQLRKDTLLHLIELKDTLLANKRNGVLYYHTDNHWNSLGAFFVYKILLNRMKKDFPQLKPLKQTDFTLKGWRFQGGNLAGQAGLWPYMKELIFYPLIRNSKAKEEAKSGYTPPPGFGYPDEYEVVRSTSDRSLPRILVIRDSFFTPLIPLFSENFRRTVYVFDGWKYGLNQEILENEKPDIVLLEIFEPQLSNILNLSR